MGIQQYEVHLVRQADGIRTVARVRDFSIVLGAHRGDASAGFNAVETLLSAAGACLTSSLNMVAELSGVRLLDLEVDVSATRQDKPPTLTEIRYAIRVRTEADEQRLARLLSLAERNSTVVSTLRLSIPVSGEISKI